MALPTQAEVQAALNKGGVVTLPPGTYRFADLIIPAGATLQGDGRATLEGSRVIPEVAWKKAGDIRNVPYTPLPVVDGHGIAFTKGQNLKDPLGKHADQVWTRADGDTRLRRVTGKAVVVPGTFAVDASGLWVHKVDTAAGILVSDKRVAIKDLRGTLRGVAVKRYSPTPADDAAVRVNGGFLDDVAVDSCAFVPVSVTGLDATLRRVTVTRGGWMGVSARLATNLQLEACTFDQVNDRGVFLPAPQSGAVKTSRCRQVTVTGARITRTIGHGLWFDQSTADVTVTGCTITVAGRGVFFEISHGMTMTGNTVTSSNNDAVRVAGSSGVVIVGNTLTGQGPAVGIYVDERSRKGWSDPRNPITAEMKAAGVYASDRRTLAWRDPAITWMPEVRVLERNVLKSTGGKPTVIVGTKNGDAVVPKEAIVPLGHQ